jgi:hypothetical protein
MYARFVVAMRRCDTHCGDGGRNHGNGQGCDQDRLALHFTLQ